MDTTPKKEEKSNERTIPLSELYRKVIHVLNSVSEDMRDNTVLGAWKSKTSQGNLITMNRFFTAVAAELSTKAHMAYREQAEATVYGEIPNDLSILSFCFDVNTSSSGSKSAATVGATSRNILTRKV